MTLVWVVLDAENWDVLGTHEARPSAEAHLDHIVGKCPWLADDVGLRPYEDGRPVGRFETATQLHIARFGEQDTPAPG